MANSLIKNFDETLIKNSPREQKNWQQNLWLQHATPFARAQLLAKFLAENNRNQQKTSLLCILPDGQSIKEQITLLEFALGPYDLTLQQTFEQLVFSPINSEQSKTAKNPIIVAEFPAWDISPYQMAAPSLEISAARIKTLWQLSSPIALQLGQMPDLIFTHYRASVQKTMPKELLQQVTAKFPTIHKGQQLSPIQLQQHLQQLGYKPVNQVLGEAEMVRHGGILDVFLTGYQKPVRLDFFGNQLEGIYFFDPITQKRITATENHQPQLSSLILLPAEEILITEQNQEFFYQHWRNQFGVLALKHPMLMELSQESASPASKVAQSLPIGFHQFQPLWQKDIKQLPSLFDYLTTHSNRPDTPKRMAPTAITNAKQPLIWLQGHADLELKSFWQEITDHYQFRQQVLNYDPKTETKKTDKKLLNLRLPALPPEFFYWQQTEWQNFLTTIPYWSEQPTITNKHVSIYDLGGQKIFPFAKLENQKESTWQKTAKQLQILIQQQLATATEPKSKNQKAHRLLLACHSDKGIERLQKLLTTNNDAKDYSANLTGEYSSSFCSPEQQQFPLLAKVARLPPLKPLVMAAVLPLHKSEILPDLTIITESDIFGIDYQPAKPKSRALKPTKQLLKNIASLKLNDYVVHVDYGIARYLGLKPIHAGGHIHDCVALEYRGGDKLFLPIENLELLQHYGSVDDDAPPQLDQLGSGDWQERVARMKKRILAMAQELAKNAASRLYHQAKPLESDSASDAAFAAHFPFVETPDQERAIEQVKQDLLAEKPMDRLICGDVGFGKTEIALRASFTAVKSNQQVLVITPTTLLSRQHYQNFQKRFQPFGIKVGQLSRLTPLKQKKIILQELADGKVDIVIGTHALLQKNLQVKNLGLVIVDEEHHFGVAQKEQARALAKSVHYLSMSATPIPRSLQLSLSGIKELSLITTPPSDRLAIKTAVVPTDPLLLKTAINQELARGGQLFFVAPRINQLTEIEHSLKNLVPTLRLMTAHGQMPAQELDERMTEFAAGEADGLLATNIIESGIDLPNVNSMIIFHAEQFGLAQLYQLRGRVGRSGRQGYCYITYPYNSFLSRSAKKRLEILDGMHYLGAGFTLASHDMDLRGAGNLLGKEQTGHIKEVGVELYQKMVTAAIAEMRTLEKLTPPIKTQQPPISPMPQSNSNLSNANSVNADFIADWSPKISFNLSVALPNDYIPDQEVRLQLYKELSNCRSLAELNEIKASMADRFGKLPETANNLMLLIHLKILALQTGLELLQIGQLPQLHQPHNNFVKPTGVSLTISFHPNYVRKYFYQPNNQQQTDILPILLNFINKKHGKLLPNHNVKNHTKTKDQSLPNNMPDIPKILFPFIGQTIAPEQSVNHSLLQKIEELLKELQTILPPIQIQPE